MALAPGSRIGSYSIVAQIGAGGMGEVYRARDSRLGREVAVKVLPEPFAADEERLARFEREAQLLASLNHPNIAHIHGIEESGEIRALVMELVEGDTLADRVARGRLSLDETRAIAAQIADALQFAHDHGVVHRDLKPANVKVTSDGVVKVLDFGLAKAMGVDAMGESVSDISHSPTVSIGSTRAGLILGTAAYMSPEQARGKNVDKRTDIWAFGCVIYECLTARKAFEGETVSDTISLILQREPDWNTLPASTPAGVRRLLSRCLEKDAKKRLRDIGDARLDLDDTSVVTGDAPRGWLRWQSILAGIVLVALGAAGGYFVHANRARNVRAGAGTPSAAPTHVSLATPPGMRGLLARLSPDGRRVVFLAANTDGPVVNRIYVRSLDAFEMRPLPGTEGATMLALSADGRRVIFVAPLSSQGSERRLAGVPIDGSSPPVTIASMEDSWVDVCSLPNGDLLIASADGKYVRMSSNGGAPVEHQLHRGSVTSPNNWWNVLPDGNGVLAGFSGWQSDGYHIDAAVLDLRTDSLRVIVKDAGYLAYASTGHLVFSRGDVLFAAPFDAATQSLTGDAVALFGGLKTSESWNNAFFALSASGTLLFEPGGRTGINRQLISIDAQGSVEPLSDERRAFAELAARSDGRQITAAVANARGVFELWIGDGERPQFRPLIALPGADCAEATWSHDGRRIAFARRAQKMDDGIYITNVDASGDPVRIVAGDGSVDNYHPWSWTPDGAWVLGMLEGVQSGKTTLLAFPADGSGSPRPIDVGRGNVMGSVASPDGRYLAWLSDVTGRFELYVAEYHPPTGVGARVRVSSDGVSAPPSTFSRFGWRRPGEIIFVDLQGRLMASTLTAHPVLAASAPVSVADLHALRVGFGSITPLSDGRVIAVQKGNDENDAPTLSLIINWYDELKRMMAAH